MSRNRMKNSQSLQWMGVIKWILIAALLAGLGLCYVLCKNQNLHLAQEVQSLQDNLDTIKSRNTNMEADLRRMKSPIKLERELAMMHSTLISLDDPRLLLVRLDEDTRARLERDGTVPRAYLNFNAAPVASVTPGRN
jgi:uncharacterized protein HemX